jgi:hypothetical protein
VNGQTSAILHDPHGNHAVIHTTLFSATPALTDAVTTGHGIDLHCRI